MDERSLSHEDAGQQSGSRPSNGGELDGFASLVVSIG